MSFKIEPIDVKVNDTVLHPLLPTHPSLLAIVAPRKSGKTTLLVNMLTRADMYKAFFHEIHIWSPTINLDKKWEKVTKFLPKDWIHTHFDENEFLDLMERVKLRIEAPDLFHKEKKAEEENEPWKDLKNNPLLVRGEKFSKKYQENELDEKKNFSKQKRKPNRILFVFDDSASEKGLFTKGSFTNPAVKAAFTSRHYGISMWMVSQSYKAISPPFRNNIHHWIIFNIPNDKEGSRMAEELNGTLRPDGFLQLLLDVTAEPYQFLYINFEAENRDDIFRKGFSKPLDIETYKTIKKRKTEYDPQW